MFQKYIHLERFGTDEVDGINVGECHIFPKVDGSNAVVWNEDGAMAYGSRNRQLQLGDDNQGFALYASHHLGLASLVQDHPSLRLYGEWLVPHSLRTYREDAWRKFYLFDVTDANGNFLHYDEYSRLAQTYGIDFLPCILKAANPTYEVLQRALESNRYLLQENSGVGEGIVVKRYGYQNRFGRCTWAKLITNTFKDKHIQTMGGSVVANKLVEEAIADEFITGHTVEKIIAKIRNESPEGSFSARAIPQLLGMAFHDLVTEELWQAIKQHKNPKIDFKTLAHCSNNRVKALKPELFGARI